MEISIIDQNIIGTNKHMPMVGMIDHGIMVGE